MKAILVIDMPESCFDCPCESEYLCGAARKELFYEADRKPEWCPLKEMPQKYDGDKQAYMNGEPWYRWYHLTEYEHGWNACIEEIEK